MIVAIHFINLFGFEVLYGFRFSRAVSHRAPWFVAVVIGAPIQPQNSNWLWSDCLWLY